MLSEEEKKAIEDIEKRIKYFENNFGKKLFSADVYDFADNLKIALNLIERQNKKIEDLENLNEHQSKDITKAVDYTFELNKEIELKDNMIDELIPRAVLTTEENEEVLEMQLKSVNKSFIDCVKQYFREKVEKIEMSR